MLLLCLSHLSCATGLELCPLVISQANVSEHTFKRALGEAISENAVVVVPLGGRGNPTAYQSALPLVDSGPLDGLLDGAPGAGHPMASNDSRVLDSIVLDSPTGLKHAAGLKWPETERDAVLRVEDDPEPVATVAAGEEVLTW